MTIKIEREALISVINTAPSWPSSPCEAPSISFNDDEFVLVNLPDKSCCLQCPERLRYSPESDEDSLCTSSTLSLSSSDSESISTERKVSFAPNLVTDVWVRPFTPREDIPRLHYSIDDTNRFRHEYRLERKVLSELSVDPDTFPVENEELSDLFGAAPPSGQSPMGRHCISRVVVLHNNKLETFVKSDEKAPEEPSCGEFFDNPAFWSGAITWY